ncbi:MAG: proprotein convertase P-domain-containing protein, partial [Anaerolineae bacterium]|nr:proprotein convertase P-domain-containing protein [Anaerolineae bacterium]
GDYSGIGVDPADDCTFWYTTEYMSGGSSATRVVSFRLDPDFVVAPSPTVVDMCGATGDAIYGVSLAKTCALDGTVTMSTGGVPSGASATWSANPVAPPGSTTLTLGNLGSVASGTYNIDIIGTATGPIIRQETVVLNLQTTAPEAVTLLSPADRATGVAGDTDLTWAAAARASNYDVQVAIDPGFTNVVRSVAGLAATSYTPSPSLDPGTVYYWRVRGNNACGSSDYSVTRTFSTSPVTCQSYAGAVGTITRNGTTAFNLTVPPGDVGAITDVDVIDLVGTHSTSVSDLAFALDSPNGAPIELIPSMCTGTVFNKSLDDEASDVLACPLDDGATQQPATSLSDFDGQSSTGTWVLSISNASRNRNGSLTGWSLDICKTLAPMGVDFSDLATSYGIAWHNGISTLRLGNTWTDDATFQTGDDNDDGVSFPTPLIAGQNSTIRVNVQGVPTNGRWLRVWIDWNNDGVFEDTTGPGGEYVHDGAAVDGDNNLTIAIPADYGQPVNYRARLYDSASAPSGVLAQDTGSYGGATGGEVEDDPTPAPTAVFLVRFEAATTGGAVHIEWETVSEIDHLGFHLYRSDPSSRVTLKLNEALIASQAPGTPSGAIYTWTDLEVEPGVTYSYELEDVDIHGTVTRHGPVEVTAAYSVYLPVMFK